LSTAAVTTKKVSLDGLKRLAQKHLKPSSALRNLIMSEPDELPVQELGPKVELYAKLLDHELRASSVVTSETPKSNASQSKERRAKMRKG